MKKSFFTAFLAVLLLMPAVLTAADKDSVNAEAPAPYPSFKGFVTNGFWDNWELSLGFGTGFSMYSSNNYGPFGDRFGLNGEIWAAKWLHPVVGVRAGLMGGNYNTTHPDMGKMSWPYMFAHVDGMLNMSNWIGGYREDRVYYAVLYAGMGLMGANFGQVVPGVGKTLNFAFTAGLLNKFRVSPSIDINLELRGMLGKSEINPVVSPARGRVLGTANVSVGVTYRFGKRDFDRGAAGYTLDDIKCMKREAERAALKAKETEDDLRYRLEEAENKAASAQQNAEKNQQELIAAGRTIEQYELEAATPEDMVFFDYGMAILRPEDRIRLTVLAEKIKNGPQDHVYTVTGYADFNTGTQDRNTALSVKRAKTVYDFLISLGVPAEQLAYSGTDRNSQPFSGEGNQTVIIR